MVKIAKINEIKFWEINKIAKWPKWLKNSRTGQN